MKTFVIAIALTLSLGVTARPQTRSFEKRALTSVQRLPASDLDAELPRRPFAAWFGQVTGPQAGIVWQLTECGERIVAPNGGGEDLPACVEVSAGLPDGVKVIVAISVGTFKTGLIGKPAFLRAVIEHDEQLYQAPSLHAVSEMLVAPDSLPSGSAPATHAQRSVDLPAIEVFPDRVKPPLRADLPNLTLPKVPTSNPALSGLGAEEAPPSPPKRPQPPQKVSEGVLQGKATIRVKPTYPLNARTMNALGTVRVLITISETGEVIEARAISGHLALRGAAVEAAFKWVFKPTTLNGEPVQVQGVLTFNFMPGSQ